MHTITLHCLFRETKTKTKNLSLLWDCYLLYRCHQKYPCIVKASYPPQHLNSSAPPPFPVHSACFHVTVWIFRVVWCLFWTKEFFDWVIVMSAGQILRSEQDHTCDFHHSLNKLFNCANKNVKYKYEILWDCEFI